MECKNVFCAGYEPELPQRCKAISIPSVRECENRKLFNRFEFDIGKLEDSFRLRGMLMKLRREAKKLAHP